MKQNNNLNILYASMQITFMVMRCLSFIQQIDSNG